MAPRNLNGRRAIEQFMLDHPRERAEFLLQRAAKLRMVAEGMPPDVGTQLLYVAVELENRAAKLEGSKTFKGGEGS
jgi:hypothetical protein